MDSVYNKVDRDGRRFREIGNGMREYEPEITICGLSIPEGKADNIKKQLDDLEKRGVRKK